MGGSLLQRSCHFKGSFQECYYFRGVITSEESSLQRGHSESHYFRGVITSEESSLQRGHFGSGYYFRGVISGVVITSEGSLFQRVLNKGFPLYYSLGVGHRLNRGQEVILYSSEIPSVTQSHVNW